MVVLDKDPRSVAAARTISEIACVAGTTPTIGTLCRFSDGEALRRQGTHYADLCVILEGQVFVTIDRPELLRREKAAGPGTAIGEIGFLNGVAATADVVARGPVTAWRLNDEALSLLERSAPEAARELLRALVVVASDRVAADAEHFAAAGFGTRRGATETPQILLCRTQEHLLRAQRLRYAVYCRELGRTSPHADHDARLIRDALDNFGHVFLAQAGDAAVGTIRANRPTEGDLGLLAEIYGMTSSPHYPDKVTVVTKLAVDPAFRKGPLALRLISALVRYGDRYAIREVYIDSIPALVHYYRALGFTPCAPLFLHRENGPSLPMRLDLARHRTALARDPGPLSLTGFIIRAKLHKLRARLERALKLRKVAEGVP